MTTMIQFKGVTILIFGCPGKFAISFWESLQALFSFLGVTASLASVSGSHCKSRP